MSKMKEYDIYVPECYNNGMPVEEFKIEGIKNDLLANFEGLSVTTEPIAGYWKCDNGVCRDFNHVFNVVAEDSERTRNIIVELKAFLERSLQQEQIFIIVRDVEVM